MLYLHKKQEITFSKSAGFTIVELLVAIGIMVIMGGVAVLNLAGFKDKRQFDVDKQQIVSVLRDAQNRSISQQKGLQWGVHFENPTSGQNFYALFSGTTYSTSSSESVLYLPTSEKFSTPASGASQDVIFQKATGLVTPQATVQIYLVNKPAVTATISVDTNGRVNW